MSTFTFQGPEVLAADLAERHTRQFANHVETGLFSLGTPLLFHDPDFLIQRTIEEAMAKVADMVPDTTFKVLILGGAAPGSLDAQNAKALDAVFLKREGGVGRSPRNLQRTYWVDPRFPTQFPASMSGVHTLRFQPALEEETDRYDVFKVRLGS